MVWGCSATTGTRRFSLIAGARSFPLYQNVKENVSHQLMTLSYIKIEIWRGKDDPTAQIITNILSVGFGVAFSKSEQS